MKKKRKQSRLSTLPIANVDGTSNNGCERKRKWPPRCIANRCIDFFFLSISISLFFFEICIRCESIGDVHPSDWSHVYYVFIVSVSWSKRCSAIRRTFPAANDRISHASAPSDDLKSARENAATANLTDWFLLLRQRLLERSHSPLAKLMPFFLLPVHV